ncbi:unnamed protein product [Rotaria socialis]|uniref:Uncharacterized protein n=1 Tax=Rotaria socialis TaxID=392032 RepID=A0A817KK46_9BILA|nr:unnamed protein product [Rotaria socialis]
MKAYSLQSNIDDISPNSSISIPFLSQKTLSTNTSRTLCSTASLLSQDAIEPNENKLKSLRKYKTEGTQTKLFAILLPNSPLSVMKQAKIETRTLINVTRTCQINTLSYLIKTNESQIEIQHSLENVSNRKQIVRPSSSTSFFSNETPFIEKLLSKENVFDNKSSMKSKHQMLIGYRNQKQIVDAPNDEFKEKQLNHFISMSSSLKCINVFDNIDLDEPTIPIDSLLTDDKNSPVIFSNQEARQYYQSMHASSSKYFESQLTTRRKLFDNSNTNIVTYSNSNNNNNNKQISKSFRFKTYPHRSLYRKRQQYQNKKRIYNFLQRLCRRKNPTIISQLYISEPRPSSQMMPTDDTNQYENCLLTTQPDTIKSRTSSNRRQQSIINLNLNDSDIMRQYKAYDHTLVARASEYSVACKKLQNLLKNNDTCLEELLDSQLQLTCNNDYRSICILIDDHKQSEHYRSLFLHYIYTSLSSSLKQISENDSIQLTCMNLAFFNNSLCDIVNMQRLRLIDTGRKIFLLPACEIPLRTSNDIGKALNHLSKNMSFAHQILIINFYSKQSSLSGSFLFLQLAPICSIRSKGLLTNLNSTTYSVLNLIRQLSNGQLFSRNRARRYLLNDYSINRLLKSYLFSPQQTVTVLTMKPKLQNNK